MLQVSRGILRACCSQCMYKLRRRTISKRFRFFRMLELRRGKAFVNDGRVDFRQLQKMPCGKNSGGRRRHLHLMRCGNVCGSARLKELLKLHRRHLFGNNRRSRLVKLRNM